MLFERNSNIFKQHFECLSNVEYLAFKKVMQRINLRPTDPPMAEMDKFGQLITTKQGIISLYENKYLERLSPNGPNDIYASIQK